jgi:hypothetical protein
MTEDDIITPTTIWRGLMRGAIPAAVYAAYAGIAAAVVTGAIAPDDQFFALSGTAGLGVLIISFGLRRHYVWAHTNCSELDEREQRMRARAYEFSYGVLIFAVMMSLVVPILVIDPAQANFPTILTASAFAFILLSCSLPTATLAWRDRLEATGSVGITGRISRKTWLIWGASGVAGLIGGVFIGYLN